MTVTHLGVTPDFTRNWDKIFKKKPASEPVAATQPEPAAAKTEVPSTTATDATKTS